MTLNPLELLPFPAMLAAMALLAYIALRIVDDGETPVWPPRPTHDPAPLAEAYVMLEPPEIAADLEEPEPEIPYDPLDPRIPLAEVERRMAAAVIEAAHAAPELVGAGR